MYINVYQRIQYHSLFIKIQGISLTKQVLWWFWVTFLLSSGTLEVFWRYPMNFWGSHHSHYLKVPPQRLEQPRRAQHTVSRDSLSKSDASSNSPLNISTSRHLATGNLRKVTDVPIQKTTSHSNIDRLTTAAASVKHQEAELRWSSVCRRSSKSPRRQ